MVGIPRKPPERGLAMRRCTGDGLVKLGKRLARIDRHLVAILAKRMSLAMEVARCKINNGNEPILRKKTEEQRRAQWMAWARQEGFDPEFARTIFNVVLAESCRVQIDTKEGDKARRNAR